MKWNDWNFWTCSQLNQSIFIHKHFRYILFHSKQHFKHLEYFTYFFSPLNTFLWSYVIRAYSFSKIIGKNYVLHISSYPSRKTHPDRPYWKVPAIRTIRTSTRRRCLRQRIRSRPLQTVSTASICTRMMTTQRRMICKRTCDICTRTCITAPKVWHNNFKTAWGRSAPTLNLLESVHAFCVLCQSLFILLWKHMLVRTKHGFLPLKTVW